MGACLKKPSPAPTTAATTARSPEGSPPIPRSRAASDVYIEGAIPVAEDAEGWDHDESEVVCGELEKRAEGKIRMWSTRFFVLDRGYWSYFRTEEEYNKQAKNPIKGRRMRLAAYSVIPGDDDERRTFKLVPIVKDVVMHGVAPSTTTEGPRVFELRAESAASATQWVRAFEAEGCLSAVAFQALRRRGTAPELKIAEAAMLNPLQSVAPSDFSSPSSESDAFDGGFEGGGHAGDGATKTTPAAAAAAAAATAAAAGTGAGVGPVAAQAAGVGQGRRAGGVSPAMLNTALLSLAGAMPPTASEPSSTASNATTAFGGRSAVSMAGLVTPLSVAGGGAFVLPSTPAPAKAEDSGVRPAEGTNPRVQALGDVELTSFHSASDMTRL